MYRFNDSSGAEPVLAFAAAYVPEAPPTFSDGIAGAGALVLAVDGDEDGWAERVEVRDYATGTPAATLDGGGVLVGVSMSAGAPPTYLAAQYANGRLAVLDEQLAALSATSGSLLAGPLATSDGVTVVDLSPPAVTGAEGSPHVFSPDVPGLPPVTTISALLTDKTRLALAEVTITDPGGVVVRSYGLPASGTSDALEAAWDGRDDAGALLPSGRYAVHVTAYDLAGHAASATTGVRLLRLPAHSAARGKGSKHR